MKDNWKIITKKLVLDAKNHEIIKTKTYENELTKLHYIIFNLF